MIRQPVLAEVFAHLPVGPVDDRMNFEHPVLAFDHGQIFAGRGMLAAQSGHPNAGPQFLQCTVHRLDFVQATVFLEPLDPLLPKFSVKRLLTRRGQQRRIDLQIQPQLFRQLGGKPVSLGKKIAGIDKDDGNLRVDPGDQMEHDGRLHPKARAQRGMTAELLERPAHALRGGLSPEIAVPDRDLGIVKFGLERLGHQKRPCRIRLPGPCGKQQITGNSMDHCRPDAP